MVSSWLVCLLETDGVIQPSQIIARCLKIIPCGNVYSVVLVCNVPIEPPLCHLWSEWYSHSCAHIAFVAKNVAVHNALLVRIVDDVAVVTQIVLPPWGGATVSRLSEPNMAPASRR